MQGYSLLKDTPHPPEMEPDIAVKVQLHLWARTMCSSARMILPLRRPSMQVALQNLSVRYAAGEDDKKRK